VVDSLNFWLQAGLLADLIDCYAIELIVPFDGDYLLAVCVYRVFAAFPQQVEAVIFQVANDITSFDRHARPQPEVVRLTRFLWEILYEAACTRGSFRRVHPLHFAALLEILTFGDNFRPLDKLTHVPGFSFRIFCNIPNHH
jgi:hypothetical protein